MRDTQPIHARVILAGGVTGGHIMPGLALREALLRKAAGIDVQFMGRGGPFENALVSAAGASITRVRCLPSPKKFWGWPTFAYENVRGYLEARQYLGNARATAVVGLGGYASAPAARAAIDLGIPLVLLEQNATHGRVTRWLARRAVVVCASFANADSPAPRQGNLVRTGTPIRPIERSRRKLPFRRPLLLVLGGSGGSSSLNQLTLNAAKDLPSDAIRPWRIVHQSGERDRAWVARAYRELGLTAQVRPFVRRLDRLLPMADLVISRAGGTTSAELAAAGVATVFVPWRGSADDHQFANASALARAGAALVVDESKLDATCQLSRAIEELIDSAHRREALAQAIGRLARPDAADRVAEIVLRVLGGAPSVNVIGPARETTPPRPRRKRLCRV